MNCSISVFQMCFTINYSLDCFSPPFLMLELWERRKYRVSLKNHTERWLPMAMSILTSTSINFHSSTFFLENNPMVLVSSFLDQWFQRWDLLKPSILNTHKKFKLKVAKSGFKPLTTCNLKRRRDIDIIRNHKKEPLLSMLYYIFYPHENNKEPTEHIWLHTNSYYISLGIMRIHIPLFFNFLH